MFKELVVHHRASVDQLSARRRLTVRELRLARDPAHADVLASTP